MAARHGMERIYTWGKRITIFGFFVGMALWIAAIVLRVPIGFGLVTFPMAIGGVLWLTAWLFQGVAPESKPSQRPPQ